MYTSGTNAQFTRIGILGYNLQTQTSLCKKNKKVNYRYYSTYTKTKNIFLKLKLNILINLLKYYQWHSIFLQIILIVIIKVLWIKYNPVFCAMPDSVEYTVPYEHKEELPPLPHYPDKQNYKIPDPKITIKIPLSDLNDLPDGFYQFDVDGKLAYYHPPFNNDLFIDNRVKTINEYMIRHRSLQSKFHYDYMNKYYHPYKNPDYTRKLRPDLIDFVVPDNKNPNQNHLALPETQVNVLSLNFMINFMNDFVEAYENKPKSKDTMLFCLEYAAKHLPKELYFQNETDLDNDNHIFAKFLAVFEQNIHYSSKEERDRGLYILSALVAYNYDNIMHNGLSYQMYIFQSYYSNLSLQNKI